MGLRKIGRVAVHFTKLLQDNVQWWALVKREMDIRIS